MAVYDFDLDAIFTVSETSFDDATALPFDFSSDPSAFDFSTFDMSAFDVVFPPVACEVVAGARAPLTEKNVWETMPAFEEEAERKGNANTVVMLDIDGLSTFELADIAQEMLNELLREAGVSVERASPVASFESTPFPIASTPSAPSHTESPLFVSEYEVEAEFIHELDDELAFFEEGEWAFIEVPDLTPEMLNELLLEAGLSVESASPFDSDIECTPSPAESPLFVPEYRVESESPPSQFESTPSPTASPLFISESRVESEFSAELDDELAIFEEDERACLEEPFKDPSPSPTESTLFVAQSRAESEFTPELDDELAIFEKEQRAFLEVPFEDASPVDSTPSPSESSVFVPESRVESEFPPSLDDELAIFEEDERAFLKSPVCPIYTALPPSSCSSESPRTLDDELADFEEDERAFLESPVCPIYTPFPPSSSSSESPRTLDDELADFEEDERAFLESPICPTYTPLTPAVPPSSSSSPRTLDDDLSDFEADELAFLEAPLPPALFPSADPSELDFTPSALGCIFWPPPSSPSSLPTIYLHPPPDTDTDLSQPVRPSYVPTITSSSILHLHLPSPSLLHAPATSRSGRLLPPSTYEIALAPGYFGDVPRILVWAPGEPACEVEIPCVVDEERMGVPRLAWMGRMGEEDEGYYYPLKAVVEEDEVMGQEDNGVGEEDEGYYYPLKTVVEEDEDEQDEVVGQGDSGVAEKDQVVAEENGMAAGEEDGVVKEQDVKIEDAPVVEDQVVAEDHREIAEESAMPVSEGNNVASEQAVKLEDVVVETVPVTHIPIPKVWHRKRYLWKNFE